jgi:hypothetical protein
MRETMSNQIFHWPRFVQCLLYFLRRDSTTLWIAPLVVFGLAQFSLSGSPGGVTTFLIMLASFVYTSRTCRELGGSPASGLQLILLPASSLEKILSMWMLSAIMFPGLLLLSAWVAIDARSLVIQGMMYRTITHQEGDPVTWLGVLPGMMITTLRFWAVQAVFLWGSIYFRKKAFVKTGLLLFITYLVVQLALLLCFLLICLIADGMQEFSGASEWWSHVGETWVWIKSATYFLSCMLFPLFLGLALHRFRIAEV